MFAFKRRLFLVVSLLQLPLALASRCLDQLISRIGEAHELSQLLKLGTLSPRNDFSECMPQFKALRTAGESLRVDLSAPLDLAFVPPWRGEPTQMPARWRELSEYEIMVLSLRSGDTVVFDDQEFVLGAFLGRGNSTHIWSVENIPEAAIRLPIPIVSLAKSGTESVFHRGRELTLCVDVIRRSQSGIPIYSIDERSPLGVPRYLLVKRIHGAQSGASLIYQLSNGRIDPQSSFSYFRRGDLEQILHEKSAASEKLSELFQLMRRDHEIPWSLSDLHYASSYPSQKLIVSRQYLYDEEDQRWYRADAY